jgi:hypothetical protein
MNYTPHVALHAIASASAGHAVPRLHRPRGSRHDAGVHAAEMQRCGRQRTRHVTALLMAVGAMMAVPSGLALFLSTRDVTTCVSLDTATSHASCDGAGRSCYAQRSWRHTSCQLVL